MGDPSKTAVIANPASRGGWVGKHWHQLSSQIRKKLGSVEFRLTEDVGHGTRIARDLVGEGFETIVSFGGDGTHSEIVDGIMGTGKGRNIAIGILHAGTGGDFRKMIEASDDLDRACDVILNNEPTPIDVGWVQYVEDDGQTASRHFLNITSMGMSGLVDRLVAEARLRNMGSLAYLSRTLRAQISYKPAKIRLTIDGDDKGDYDISALCVCNGRWAGGGMMFAPKARVGDGLFDIIAIRAASTLRGLPVMAGLYKGTHVHSQLVDSFRGKHVQVDMLGNTAWMDIDGEAPGTGPAEFRIHEHAVQMIGVKPVYL